MRGKKMLQQEIANIVDRISSNIENRNIQNEISDQLIYFEKQAQHPVDHFHLITDNLVYMIESVNIVKSMLGHCIEEEFFPDVQEFTEIFLNAQKKISEDRNALRNKYKDLYVLKEDISESISISQFNFAVFKVKFNIELEFLSIFINPENKKFMSEFLEYNRMVFLSTLDNVTDSFSSSMVQKMTPLLQHMNVEFS
jgi:hypothetical protein